MGTLLQFNFEGGTDGGAATTGTTGASQITSGKFTHQASAAKVDALGLQVATATTDAGARFPLSAAALSAAVTFWCKLPTTSSGQTLRTFATLRHASGVIGRWQYSYATSTTVTVRFLPNAGGSGIPLGTFTSGSFYRISAWFTVATSTTGQSHQRVFDSTGTQVGSDSDVTNANLGTVNIAAVDLGILGSFAEAPTVQFDALQTQDALTDYLADMVPNQGSASGAVIWAGASTGARQSAGTAAGGVAWAGAATGARRSAGSGAGSIVQAASATGATVMGGAGSGAISWGAAATGATTRHGAAAGVIAWDGAGTGSAPVVPGSQGSAAGGITWTGAGTGARSSTGSSAGSIGWAGTATGQAPVVGGASGAGSGAVAWAGTATGSKTSAGTGAGSIHWTGDGTGATVRRGAATGTVTWAAVATGVGLEPIPIGGVEFTIVRQQRYLATVKAQPALTTAGAQHWLRDAGKD